MLSRAEFSADQIASGDQVDIAVDWRAAQATTLFLNFDAALFSIAPSSVALAASPNGTSTQVVRVTITRVTAAARFCDVHFVEGVSDAFDTVEVV